MVNETEFSLVHLTIVKSEKFLMKKIEQIAPEFVKREIERGTPQVIKREVEKVAPKVIKTFTPWYIRWFYSLFGDSLRTMATSSIAPDGGTASDSVVCVFPLNDVHN